MTQRERSYLEDKLFSQTNLNPVLHACIEGIYNEYKATRKRYPSMHEPIFGMLYCEMILTSESNEKPNCKEIRKYTKEPQTTYYTYRKMVLEYIGIKIKEQNSTSD